MPFKSKSQQRYMNWAASQGKIKQSTVDEFNEASKGKTSKLPEHVKQHKADGGQIMKSLADAIKKKREMSERKMMWRGGLADVERDIMPVEVVGDDGLEEQRKQELGEHDDELIAEAKKKEEHAPDEDDTKKSKILEDTVDSYAKGGMVEQPKPMAHTPEHFSELNEKERFQMAMKHLDGAAGMPHASMPKEEKSEEMQSKSLEKDQPEVMPASPMDKHARMLAEGGLVGDDKPRHPEHFSQLSEKERFQMAMKHLDGMKPQEAAQPDVMPSSPKDKQAQMLADGGKVSPHEHFSELNEKKHEQESQSLEHPISEESESPPHADLHRDEHEPAGMEVPEHHIHEEHREKYAHGDEVKMEHIKDDHKHMYAHGGKLPKLGSGKRFAAIEKSAAASGAENPAAVAAAAGRKAHGAKQMAKWASAGKKHASLADALKHRK